MQVYRAMLNHPASWNTRAQNMRPPEEFISASLRGLAVPEADMRALEQRQIKNLFWDHMGQMGQQWMRPAGPDGWDEDDGAWVTPQGIAGRMAWAMGVPKQIMRDLPEPAQLMRDVMGDAVPGKVAFAAQAAESRSDAVGLILMSPAFQRR